MTRLIYDDTTYVWRCDDCKGPMRLPGIAPDISTLYCKGWKHCPYCGEKIDYSTSFRIERAMNGDE